MPRRTHAQLTHAQLTRVLQILALPRITHAQQILALRRQIRALPIHVPQSATLAHLNKFELPIPMGRAGGRRKRRPLVASGKGSV